MKVIKRNSSEVTFDISKIITAITKANEAVEEDARLTPMQIKRIAEAVELSCIRMNRAPEVEEIQDLVESQIMAHGAYEVAKKLLTENASKLEFIVEYLFTHEIMDGDQFLAAGIILFNQGFFFIYGNAGPVANMLVAAGEGIVHGGFTGIGIAGQCNSHSFFLS